MRPLKNIPLKDKILGVISVILILLIITLTVVITISIWTDPETRCTGNISELVCSLLFWGAALFWWGVIYAWMHVMLISELVWTFWRKVI